MSMQVFTMGLSRLVPLLFAASAILVLGRIAYDRLRPHREQAARGIFALILLGGAAALAPWAWRGAVLTSAEHAFWRADWAAAADRYAHYARLRGSFPGRTGARRALALMNLRRFDEAESAFLASLPRPGHGTVQASPNDVLSLGLCRYYTGRLDAAERTVRAVAPGVSPMRDYILGRIHDRMGESGEAVAAFRASLAQAPCFYPSFYHLVRALRRDGHDAEARSAIASFCPSREPSRVSPLTALLPGTEGEVPPEKEFYFVQED